MAVLLNSPISDCYWVHPGQLLAGEYPRDWDDDTSRHKAGVVFFLDLTEAGEYGLRPYRPLFREEAVAPGQAVDHCRMPIRDMDTPTPQEMVRILDTIDAQLAEGHTVYVHCFGGIGRTGTVVGCYLVRHGKSGREALDEIESLRRDVPAAWQRSPETEMQRQMVRAWCIGK